MYIVGTVSSVIALRKCDVEIVLKLLMPVRKKETFSNSIHPDEVAHDEPPYLNIYRLPSSI